MNPFACLNDDVLNIVLSLLSPSDAGKLAWTCRAAYTHAIPRYLSDVTLGLEVHRKPKSQFASFCHFVLSGAPNRASFLRRLELRQEVFPWVDVGIKAKIGDPFGIRTNRDYSLASLLAEVIQQADGLEEVHVADAEPLLASEPRLTDALASRPRLRSVTLEMCGSAGLECISRLSGDICSLALMIHGPFVRQSSLYHNLSALARSARTLRYLEVDGAMGMTRGLDPDFTLPSVRQLTLRGLTDLYTILRVVPSLRTLHMYTCRFPTFTPVDAPYIDLDELIADAPVPLACTVRRVELHFNAFFHDEPDWVPLLERMDPVVLSCHAGWSLPARDVARNLASLQHLELHVNWRIKDGVPDTPREAWLTSFVSVFSPVKLVGLVLHIRRGVLVDPTVPLDVLARDIAGACNSSLQFIGISLERHPLLDVPITVTWYRCVRDNSPAGLCTRLEALPSLEGDLVEDRLRLLDRLHLDGPKYN